MKHKEQYDYDTVCEILIPAMEKGYELIEQEDADACVEVLKKAIQELDRRGGVQ